MASEIHIHSSIYKRRNKEPRQKLGWKFRFGLAVLISDNLKLLKASSVALQTFDGPCLGFLWVSKVVSQKERNKMWKEKMGKR